MPVMVTPSNTFQAYFNLASAFGPWLKSFLVGSVKKYKLEAIKPDFYWVHQSSSIKGRHYANDFDLIDQQMLMMVDILN